MWNRAHAVCLTLSRSNQQNNANLQAAIQTLGAEQQNGDRSGDVMGTRVWWDCKPYNK